MSIFAISISHAEHQERSRELSQLRSEIGAVKEKMQIISRQKSLLIEQLAEIEKRYGEMAASLKTLTLRIKSKRDNLNSIRRQIDDYHNDIRHDGKALSGHIRSAYVMGKQEKLKLLLNMEDPSLSSRMLAYYSYLNKSRLQKLTDITGKIKRLQELGRQRQAETKALESDIEKKKLEQSSLDNLRYERNALLAHWSKDFSSHQQQLSDLLVNEQKLNDLVHDLEKKEQAANDKMRADSQPSLIKNDDAGGQEVDFSALKGKLPWPLKNDTGAGSGRTKAETAMDGILINAEEGAEIRAVTAGKVVYSEWLRGYGLLTIIDHGNGYMTLYAFNQSLYAQTGEWVEAGEVIASVGQSGGRSRPGLYFGIRKDGKPVDPLAWYRN